MKLVNTRIARDNESTLGLLTINSQKFFLLLKMRKEILRLKEKHVFHQVNMKSSLESS